MIRDTLGFKERQQKFASLPYYFFLKFCSHLIGLSSGHFAMKHHPPE
jgi:hypothetical protein